MATVADEWRAQFAEQRWRAERGELWARISAKGESNSHSGSKPTSNPVVFEIGHVVDSTGDGVPMAARRVETVALGAGWSVHVVASVAAVPRTGILRVVTVRGARHDERFWAAWWNGRFECAQYLRRGGAIERLGFRTTKARRGVMDAIEGRRLEST